MIVASSLQNTEVSFLFWWVLGVCGAIFLGVWAVIYYCSVRFGAPSGDPEEAPEPYQNYGHRNLEILWSVIPAIILLVFAVATVRAMTKVLPPADRPPDIVVTGHQWWWQIDYPSEGFTTANEFVIPAGKATLIGLESADVIHSFWSPELAPKQDMIPGHQRHIWITDPQPGTYSGVCGEFCGAQHAKMRFEIKVMPQEEYDQWVASQKKPAETTASNGAELFSALTCNRCHAIAGTTASGTSAPDLTHYGSRQWLAARELPNTPENLTEWLREPDAIKPGSHMPDLKLSEEDLDALVSYLLSLK